MVSKVRKVPVAFFLILGAALTMGAMFTVLQSSMVVQDANSSPATIEVKPSALSPLTNDEVASPASTTSDGKIRMREGEEDAGE